jgi:hypothetical protein
MKSDRVQKGIVKNALHFNLLFRARLYKIKMQFLVFTCSPIRGFVGIK